MSVVLAPRSPLTPTPLPPGERGGGEGAVLWRRLAITLWALILLAGFCRSLVRPGRFPVRR